jgi:glycosyltransferase involved in cell wall biosynthesis
LAAAWEELLSLDRGARARLGQAARRRIQQRYDLGAIARRYEDLYDRLLAGEPPSSVRPQPDVPILSG